MAIASLERTLAQTSVDAADLETVEAELTKEAKAEFIRVGIRGERAGMHECFKNVAAGRVPAFPGIAGISAPNLWERILDVRGAEMWYRSDAWMLRHRTKVLAAAGLPGKARYDAIRMLDAEPAKLTDYAHYGARLLTNSDGKIADSERSVRNRIHCAIAGVAAERFRLQQDRWPADLEELVRNGLLKSVPEDLFAGKPLRFRRAADGIVIHSVGADGKYLGDALDRRGEMDRNSPRIEFRLWDPASRRQMPLPPKEES
jgi:hypothetical protein